MKKTEETDGHPNDKHSIIRNNDNNGQKVVYDYFTDS